MEPDGHESIKNASWASQEDNEQCYRPAVRCIICSLICENLCMSPRTEARKALIYSPMLPGLNSIRWVEWIFIRVVAELYLFC